MNARRDALAAAAKLALEIRNIARKHPDAVCTMGSLKTFPGIVTAVVGCCEATLDQRDLDVAERLLVVLAMVIAGRWHQPTAPDRRGKESLVAAYERLWDLRHPDPNRRLRRAGVARLFRRYGRHQHRLHG